MLILVYTSHRSCLYQSLVLVYTRRSLVRPVALWWGALLGSNTPVERFQCRLREGSERGLRGCEGSGWGPSSVWLESTISNTMCGRVPLSKAAASGKAASICSHVSGRAARGSSGYTIPGLSCPASLASLQGPVNWCLEGSPEKGLVRGCWRADEERPNPEMLSLIRVAVKSCLGSIWAGL